MSDKENIKFIDNTATTAGNGRYIGVVVNVEFALESWKQSLYSFEWLSSDGAIKTLEDLPETEQSKRETVEKKLENGEPLEKPILGIGLQDNVEIGSGRAEFLTLAAHGLKQIPVHILKSNESDFKDFLADVD